MTTTSNTPSADTAEPEHDVLLDPSTDALLTYAAQQQALIGKLEGSIGSLKGDTRGVTAIVAEMKAKSALIADQLKPPAQPHVELKSPPSDAPPAA